MSQNLYFITVLSLLLCLLLSGCGQKDSGPTAQELLRRKQLRQSAELSKTKTVEEKLAVVEDHLASGNAVAAAQSMRPLLISDPEHPAVIMLSAKCEAAVGNKVAAAKTLEAVDPSDQESYSEALWLAAGWLVDANRFDEAQQKLQQMLQPGGDVTRVHRKLALILNNQGRRIEAAPHLRALARSGKIQEKELFAMSCYSEPFIDESLPKPDFSGQLTAAALMQAKLSRVEGEMDRARQLAQTLAQAFPDSTQISAFLGRLYADFQDDEALRRWLAATPDGIQREPEYWHTLGVWLQRQGQDREAVRCLTECVIRDPTDRVAYAALARSLKSLGENAAADRVVERFELLERIASITKSLGSRKGTRQELNRLADTLDKLQRPFEAIAWRAIALKLHGGSEHELAALKKQRASMRAEGGAAELPPQDFLACGLDVQQWPLPSAGAIGSAIAGQSKPPSSRGDVGPIVLTNVAGDVGLDFQYDNGDDPRDDRELLHQLTGGGIGVIDFDLDGWSDLYFTQGGGDAFKATDSLPNPLFRNLSGQRFSDVTNQTGTGDRGYGQGVAVADINQDGFADLVVANIGPNRMYLNNGDGTFAAHSLPVSNAQGDWTTSIACGDLSGDHLPEILDVNYVDDPTALTLPCTAEQTSCVPTGFTPAVDYVWQVQADMTISPWQGCQEIGGKPSYGFAAVIADFDGKPGNELFIANDGKHNHYWVSPGDDDSANRTLIESSRIYGCDAGLFGELPGCMGIAYGDIDRNGTLDLHVTNFWTQPADLYLQHPSGLFSNGNVSRGLFQETRLTVGWGTHAIDFDRDGWLDLAVFNGHVHDYGVGLYKMRPQLFRGGTERFVSVKPDGPSDDFWSTKTLGRTLAVLDWNGDSRMDLVGNHLDVPVALLENQTRGGNSFQIELVGTTSERDAIGTKVTVTCGDQVWTGWVAGGDGFLCSNEPVIDFGIGTAEKIDRVDVTWASGVKQRFTEIPANERVLVVEADQEVFRRR